MRRQKRTWYAAHVILYVKVKRRTQRSFLAWENVYLVMARSSKEAQRRAESLGRAEVGQPGLVWKGMPAELVFGGVRKLVSCAADPKISGPSTVPKLYDGVEATYSTFIVQNKSDLDALIKGKAVAIVYED